MATILREFKDGYMKVNYPKIIEASSIAILIDL
jgi:hypothetical protein